MLAMTAAAAASASTAASATAGAAAAASAGAGADDTNRRDPIGPADHEEGRHLAQQTAARPELNDSGTAISFGSASTLAKDLVSALPSADNTPLHQNESSDANDQGDDQDANPSDPEPSANTAAANPANLDSPTPPDFLIIVRIESTHDGAHPGDPESGQVDDLVLPVADPLRSTLSPTDQSQQPQKAQTHLVPNACPAPPTHPQVPMDQAEALALAWCIYHVPTSRVLGRHLHLCAPQATPVAPYTEARSGISARDVLDVPGIDAAVRALEESLVQHGWSRSTESADNNKFAFLTYNAFDLRLQLPSECRRKRLALPALLAQPNYLLLTKEVQKWMCHHPDSAHDLASFALRDLCYYFRADLAPGVPIGRLPAAGKCHEFSANFPIPAGLDLVPYRTAATNDNNRQQADQDDSTNPLLPSPLHRCESMANLVTALRAYQYADVLSLPIDARAGAAQFTLEQSYVLHLAGLPRDPAPSQADLLAWFQGYGMQPTKLHMLVTRARMPTGDGFAEFANHEEAKVALAMNGRMFRASKSVAAAAAPAAKSTGASDAATAASTAGTGGMIEVSASSPVVLQHAGEFLTAFPNEEHLPGSGRDLERGNVFSANHSYHLNRHADWMCPNCTFNNFGSRNVCLRCHTVGPHAGGTGGGTELSSSAPTGAAAARAGRAGGMHREHGRDRDHHHHNHHPRELPPGLSFSDPVSLALLGDTASSNASSMGRRGSSATSPPPSSAPPANHSEWSCCMCSTRNFGAPRARCLHCGAPRSGIPPSALAVDPNTGMTPWAGQVAMTPPPLQGASPGRGPEGSGRAMVSGEPDTWSGPGSVGSGAGGRQEFAHGYQSSPRGPRNGPGPRGGRGDLHHEFGTPRRSGSRPDHHHSPYAGGGNANNNAGSQSPMRPGDWLCPNDECRFQNFASRAMCLRCGTPSPTPPSAMCPVPFRAGDWLCVACSAHNFASRINCVRCGCTKAFSVAASQGLPTAMGAGGSGGGGGEGRGAMTPPPGQQQQQQADAYGRDGSPHTMHPRPRRNNNNQQQHQQHQLHGAGTRFANTSGLAAAEMYSGSTPSPGPAGNQLAAHLLQQMQQQQQQQQTVAAAAHFYPPSTISSGAAGQATGAGGGFEGSFAVGYGGGLALQQQQQQQGLGGMALGGGQGFGQGMGEYRGF